MTDEQPSTRPTPKTPAERMRAKRARDAEKRRRRARETEILGEIADRLVDARCLPEWDAENLEAIKMAVFVALDRARNAS